ncbi:hypothetical protein AVEN_52217-1 [Araneus ventricosus]|uniref:DUF4817 domain-containing protein n=1 Tax=Araneus ventricosus TaxID=182803 RepID=A0A4Y2ACU2_ARAVE|nr:hypothetical protein AVEN_52217-1 [Araneus ventricosus]
MSYLSAHHADVVRTKLSVKLFYLNQQNSFAAVGEFRRMKQMRRGPMFPCALRKTIQKFEATWHCCRYWTKENPVFYRRRCGYHGH